MGILGKTCFRVELNQVIISNCVHTPTKLLPVALEKWLYGNSLQNATLTIKFYCNVCTKPNKVKCQEIVCQG
jgi:hypothetical protein